MSCTQDVEPSGCRAEDYVVTPTRSGAWMWTLMGRNYCGIQ
jgi:hypothetical protein